MMRAYCVGGLVLIFIRQADGFVHTVGSQYHLAPQHQRVSAPASTSAACNELDSAVDARAEREAPNSPFSLTMQELAHHLSGLGRGRALWKALSQGYFPAEADHIIGAGGMREAKHKNWGSFGWEVTKESLANCGTRKLLLRMEDGAEIETVLIPSFDGSRTTVCVSSQVGCNRACSFCATGRMGFIRNLSADEILAQVFYARRAARLAEMPPLDNIVFMGMGEPLNNAQAVKLALRQLTDGNMFAFGRSHISVSTVGPTPNAIRQMVDMPARLAWSVHAATDDVRKQLVPTTAHTMEELRDAFAEVLLHRGKEHLFVEVTMLDGINDSPDHAQAMVQLLSTLPGRTRVNLLPYNDIGHLSYRPSSPETIEEFQRILQAGGLVATVRSTRGAGEAAACGQLATLTSKHRAAQGSLQQ